jgi:archaeal flagellar protein FlaI
MSELVLPFEPSVEQVDSHENIYECGLYRMLPEALQEACQKNVQLLEYLHMLPIEETGIPEYVPEVTRKLSDMKHRNLVYPVSDDIHIHILSSGEERDFYIPIEPTVGVDIAAKLTLVEREMVEYAWMFENLEEREEKEAALVEALSQITTVVSKLVEIKMEDVLFDPTLEQKKSGPFGLWGGSKKTGVPGMKNGKIPVTERELDAIRYVISRDKIGMGTLEPFIHDSWIEDISCSGLGPIFLEHKVFKALRSALEFVEHDDLDAFVLRLSESIQKPVTMRNPIIDATLHDGSRINIVYGREVSQRGSNFTIRKAPGIPLSILELIAFGSISYQMAAYISLVLEEGMNTFICGETASGKTTLINAVTTFIAPDAKIVTIEDTPEVMVPHPNWIREVSKAAVKVGDGAGVSMLDLLKAALRQRPNVIIIGEIRGEEGAIAFQAMQTGHMVMATFHAATVEKLIQRLTGQPINIPKTYIENLNVAIMQSLVKLPNGKDGRRAIGISEIVGYDPPSDSFSFVEVFRWNQVTDVFEFLGDKNSFLLEERIAPARGYPPTNKWGIYTLLERRAKVLAKLHERGLTGYYELLKVLNRAQQEGVF